MAAVLSVFLEFCHGKLESCLRQYVSKREWQKINWLPFKPSCIPSSTDSSLSRDISSSSTLRFSLLALAEESLIVLRAVLCAAVSWQAGQYERWRRISVTYICDGLLELFNSSTSMLFLLLQTDFLPFKLCKILDGRGRRPLHFLQKH